MDPALIRRFFDPAGGFRASRQGHKKKRESGDKTEAAPPGCDALAAYSVIGGQLRDRVAAADAALRQARAAAASGDADESTRTMDRSMGCVLGNVVGDALGAPLEFSDVRYGVSELQGMSHIEIWDKPGYNSFGLQPGQWTDDASMALCITDTLLCCGSMDPLDLRQRFHAWNTHGYNNAFGHDPQRKGRGSVGLGGNISQSMDEWVREADRRPATQAGTIYTSGNGSVMRNGAVPVWYRGDIGAGMAAAYQQSRTTHRGEEAAELCRLLTFICSKFINGAGRELLDDLSAFHSPIYNVMCLAAARREEAHEHNADPIFGGLERRVWEWRGPAFRYDTFRAGSQPGYVGSYAMDAVAMALHCVHSTASFAEATLKAANLRGDADSVCAVVGQVAGALYGASSIPEDWLLKVRKWDGGTIAARALMLHSREALGSGAALCDAACATATALGSAHAAGGA